MPVRHEGQETPLQDDIWGEGGFMVSWMAPSSFTILSMRTQAADLALLVFDRAYNHTGFVTSRLRPFETAIKSRVTNCFCCTLSSRYINGPRLNVSGFQ
jgi:hypothetical protein